MYWILILPTGKVTFALLAVLYIYIYIYIYVCVCVCLCVYVCMYVYIYIYIYIYIFFSLVAALYYRVLCSYEMNTRNTRWYSMMKCKRIYAFDVSFNPGCWKMNRRSVCVISNLSYTQSYGTGICINYWNFVWNIWHVMLWEQMLWQIQTSGYCWLLEWKYFPFCMWIRSDVFKFSHFAHTEFRSIVRVVTLRFCKTFIPSH